MKKIKSILLIAFTLFSFTALNAQDIPADEKASTRTKKMAVELALNDQQLPQVRELNLSFAKQAEELKKKEDKRGLAKLKAEYDEQLKAILSPEQYKKYNDMKKEQKSAR